MNEPHWNRLMRREAEVDDATRTSSIRYQAHLEKTIIIVGKAIVEAIWKARH